MKPSFYKQETVFSCVPACLRMVFSSFGFNISEAELIEACDCTAFGTDALRAVDAARRFGFANTSKQTLSLEELADLADSNVYPIVFVSLLPIDGIRETHSLVVCGVGEAGVSVYDPARGEMLLSPEVFRTAWGLRHNVAIIVQR